MKLFNETILDKYNSLILSILLFDKSRCKQFNLRRIYIPKF